MLQIQLKPQQTSPTKIVHLREKEPEQATGQKSNFQLRMENAHSLALELLAPKFYVDQPPRLQVWTQNMGSTMAGEQLAIVIPIQFIGTDAEKVCTAQTGMYLHMISAQKIGLIWQNYPELNGLVHRNREMVSILASFSYFEAQERFKDLSELSLNIHERHLNAALQEIGSDVDDAINTGISHQWSSSRLLRKWLELAPY